MKNKTLQVFKRAGRALRCTYYTSCFRSSLKPLGYIRMSSPPSDSFKWDDFVQDADEDNKAPASSSLAPEQPETQESPPGTLALERYKRLKDYESKYIEQSDALLEVLGQLKEMKGKTAVATVLQLVDVALGNLNDAKTTLEANILDNDTDFGNMFSEEEDKGKKTKVNFEGMQKRLRERKTTVEKWIAKFQSSRPRSGAGFYPYVDSTLEPLRLTEMHNTLTGYAADSKPKVAWAERGIRRAEQYLTGQ